MPIQAERQFRTVLIFAVIILLGASLRLDQFIDQILIDDEWHAVHQLINSNPLRILTSFGHADYSIPLTLLYWFEADRFGLSELAMRWPMMASGLLVLVLFPIGVWRRSGSREAMVFALLLAISPLLIVYSRTARPYALTLLLGYVALFAFEAYCRPTGRRWVYGLLYGLTATLATWAHLMAGPFVVMPCLLEGLRALTARPGARWQRLRRLLAIGVPTAIAILMLTLPPLLSDPGALASKAGVDLPNRETVAGVWFAWFGTESSGSVLVCLAFAAIGWQRMWKEWPIARTACAGLLLTLCLVLLSRPAWVNHSLTLARYLLPVVPLLLLSTAFGAVRIANLMAAHGGRLSRFLAVLVLVSPGLVLAAKSPLPGMLRHPDTNTLHSARMFDFRPDHNMLQRHLETFPISPLWARLRAYPPGTLRIVAAPWFFESYDWAAPRWEAAGGQRVLPGYLTGLCSEWRYGELPRSERFRFRNAVYLADIHKDGEVDILVFQKPFHFSRDVLTNYPRTGMAETCLANLVARLGGPDYEDGTISAFYLSPASRALSNAQR